MSGKSVASLLALSAATVLGAAGEGGLEAVRALKIENGVIQRAEAVADSAFIDRDGREHRELPPRTVVRLLLRPAEGSNINVEIWLPAAERWNGRFLGLGNGGAAGSINPAVFIGPLRSGYAAATTDMGTAPNADSGIGNKEVWKDFGYRATHLMTVAAKRVVRAYYGREPEFSYFSGGSTGGQQALQEAQRYPEDYDGILAQVPAHCRTPLHAYFLWNYRIFRECPFTEAQEANVIAAGNEYMASRELPQTAGKLVSDPRCTPQDIEAVVALAQKKDPTLTAKHAEALRRLFGGPVHAVTGERIFDGLPFGSTFGIARGNLYLFHWVFGKERDLMTIDFGKDIDTYTAELGPYLNADNPDLRAFERRGGKLIMVSGSADSCVPYHASLDYYERVAELFGSPERVREFCRFYIVPGMSHGPGPGVNRLPDLLKLVVEWRELGTAPEGLAGRRYEGDRPVFEIPVYPYPEKAVYDAQRREFRKISGPRGGVGRVAERFLPPAEK